MNGKHEEIKTLTCMTHDSKLGSFCNTCKKLICENCLCYSNSHTLIGAQSLVNKFKDKISADEALFKLYESEARLLRNFVSKRIKRLRNLKKNIEKELRRKIKEINTIENDDKKIIDTLITNIKDIAKDAKTNVLQRSIREGIEQIRNSDSHKEDVEKIEREMNRLKNKMKKVKKDIGKLEYYESLLSHLFKTNDDNEHDHIYLDSEYLILASLEAKGYLFEGKEHNINTSVDEFIAFDKANINQFIQNCLFLGGYEHVSNGVKIAKKVEFNKINGMADSREEVYISLSHKGILGIYSKEKRSIWVYDINDRERIRIIPEIENTTYLAFYDNNVVLLELSRSPLMIDVDTLMEGGNNFISLKTGNNEDLPEIVSLTDTSRIQATRELIYPTREGIYCYMVDSKDGSMLYNINGCVGIVSQLGITIKDVKCIFVTSDKMYKIDIGGSCSEVENIKVNDTTKYYACLPNNTTIEEGSKSILTNSNPDSDSSSKVSKSRDRCEYSLENCYWVVENNSYEYIIPGDSDLNFRDSKIDGIDFDPGLSIVRVCKDYFLCFMNNKGYFTRIIIQ